MVRLIHLNPDAPGFNDGLVLVKSTRLSATIPEREKKRENRERERDRKRVERETERKKERQKERKRKRWISDKRYQFALI